MPPTPCPQCARPLVEIRLRIDDRPVRMRSCSHCEKRWWDSEGTELDRDTVIDLAASGR